MIAYKLCSHRMKDGPTLEKEFCSFNNTYSRYTVVYEIDKWAYPILKGSLLFVFNTFESALIYARDFPSATLFECEVGEVFIPKAPTADTDKLVEYWSNGVNDDPLKIPGSYCTDKVKLLRKIER